MLAHREEEEEKKKTKTPSKLGSFTVSVQDPCRTDSMEGEKKRKRGENGEMKSRDRLKKEGETVADVEVEDEAVASQPSEEEVEEFFTILRRMHAAVKYFKKNGANFSDVSGDGIKITALEKDAVDGSKIDEKKSVVVENGVLDLNEVPEAES